MARIDMQEVIKKAWYGMLQWACRFAFVVFWKTRYFGQLHVPKTGGCLLLCTHQSYLDPPLCGAGVKRQLCYVARSTLYDNEAFGWLIDSVNALPIKRNTADVAAMKLIIDKLKKGNAVLLFPEATRSYDGRVAEVKPGFGLVSRRAQVPVVPVVVEGAFDSWPRTNKLPSPGTILVKYGELISPETIRELGDEEFAIHLTRTFRRMQNELREQLGKTVFDYD
jgi:1-acyl-sn-glycerol-3-phosphate acyltransferase